MNSLFNEHLLASLPIKQPTWENRDCVFQNDRHLIKKNIAGQVLTYNSKNF